MFASVQVEGPNRVPKIALRMMMQSPLLLYTVDRGRTTCVLEDGTVVTAMKARELGPKSVVVGDHVRLVGDTTGAEGSLARIVGIEERTSVLVRTVDDAAQFERNIAANIDQLVYRSRSNKSRTTTRTY